MSTYTSVKRSRSPRTGKKISITWFTIEMKFCRNDNMKKYWAHIIGEVLGSHNWRSTGFT